MVILTIEVAGDSTRPATDLGFLLHKHPDRVQTFPTTQGTATVFYPVATPERCRVVLRVDGAGVRGRPDADDRYVNTIPYAGSSRLVVAFGKVFGDALAGRSSRADVTSHVWPMAVTVAAVPLRGTIGVQDAFAPLGWEVDVRQRPLSPSVWGDSAVATVVLRGHATVRDALRQLSVLLPVVAGDKHYFVDDSEVGKLERLSDGWLADHPHREDIARGYVKHIRSLGEEAVARITGTESAAEPVHDTGRSSLAQTRARVVCGLVAASGARSVLDIGCGEGRLLAMLADDGVAGRLAGVDVSVDELQRAAKRLERYRAVELWQSSLMYTDDRCRGFDTAVLMEVIEHIDPERLPVAVASVFGAMAPKTVIVTTPNREFNTEYGLTGFRHPDHRFEFTRTEFADWCAQVAVDHHYAVVHHGIGDEVADVGAPTQCAVFVRDDEEVGR